MNFYKKMIRMQIYGDYKRVKVKLKQVLILLTLFIPYSVLANEKPIALPIKLNNELESPYTIIKIQNIEFPVLVDLGAANISLALDSQAAKKIFFTSNSHDLITYNSCGKKSLLKNIIIPKITFDNVILNNVSAYVYENTEACGNSKNKTHIKNGYLGILFFKNYKVLIDYPHTKIILFKNNFEIPNNKTGWKQIKFDDRKDNLIVTTEVVKGKKLKLLWDTGASTSVLKFENAPTHKNKILTLHSQTLGSVKFLVLENLKMPFDGSIGNNYFKKHRVYIDFTKHDLIIQNA